MLWTDRHRADTSCPLSAVDRWRFDDIRRANMDVNYIVRALYFYIIYVTAIA